MDFHLHALKRRIKKSWPVKSPISLQTKFRIKGDVQLAPLDECGLDLSYSAVKCIEQVEPHNSCVIFKQFQIYHIACKGVKLFYFIQPSAADCKNSSSYCAGNFEFIREINHMLNGETEWVVFKAMELGGLWIKIKSINLLKISDRVNWWTVILQVSIGKQWKEFLDYNEPIGFIFHVRTLHFMHV